MSQFFTSESIAVNATKIGLSRTKIDNQSAGGTRAQRAVVQVKTKGLYFSFNSDTLPLNATNSFEAAPGDLIEVTGYENLTHFQAITQDGSSGTIYVEYES